MKQLLLVFILLFGTVAIAFGQQTISIKKYASNGTVNGTEVTFKYLKTSDVSMIKVSDGSQEDYVNINDLERALEFIDRVN